MSSPDYPPGWEIRAGTVVLLFVLVAASIDLSAETAPAGQQVTWKKNYYNPKPLADDLVLPMPCGGAMVFRAVVVPSKDWLDDKRVELGYADHKAGYKEGRRFGFIAGTFTDKSDKTRRLYYIAKYETTGDQFAVFGESCPEPSNTGRKPAVGISWFESVDFAHRYTEWLMQNARAILPREESQSGFLRLPTDIEWKFAARGGLNLSDEAEFVARLFPMPEGDLRDYVWYDSPESADSRLHPVGLLKSNPLGLYDVLGNASEMVFMPFFLNHRGRLHGQAGGFVSRGGSIFTPRSQVRTAERQEHAYFDNASGRAMRQDSLGFRLVLSAPVIVSHARLAQIQNQWLLLPSLMEDTGEEAEKALKALKAVAAKTKDDRLRSKLELVSSELENAHTEINAIRDRSAKAMVRLGAFLGKRVSTNKARLAGIQDLIELAEAKFSRLAAQFKDKPGAQSHVDEGRRILDNKLKKWNAQSDSVRWSLDNSVSYYADTVIGVARDYRLKRISAQLAVLKIELNAKKNEYLIPYAEIFVTHINGFKDLGKADKPTWLEALVDVAKGK